MTGATPLTCADCPLPYGDSGWCDAVLPNDVWAKIAPNPPDGGVLCISCMARRLVALGLENVPLLVTSGPFISASLDEAYGRGFLNGAEGVWEQVEALGGTKL